MQNGCFTQVINTHCDACLGCGKINKTGTDCSKCNGNGSYQEEANLNFQIQKGTQNCATLIEVFGEKYIMKIIVDEDEHFKRFDTNLIFTKIITFVESIVGMSFEVPHFSGPIHVDTVQLGIIEPGKEYIVGKGMNDNGNCIVKFTVTYPNIKLDETDRNTIHDIFKKMS
jgi:DnaJ-class molecular chaperone